MERFAKRDKDGNITAKIADDYKDYGSSKLALICGLTVWKTDKNDFCEHCGQALDWNIGI